MKVKVFLSLLGLLFTAFVVYAINLQPIGQGFSEMTVSIWGWVTLLDLYLGFFIFSAIIFYVESSKLSALVWSALLMLLGNPVAVVYFVLNLSRDLDLKTKSKIKN